MIRAIAALLLTAGLWISAQAQFFNPPMWYPGTAGCSQATTYLASQSGLNATQTNAYTTAICALVSNGFFPGGATPLDALYFFVNASAANARVNVINPGTYNLTEHGTCTFTANVGMQGDGSTCYEDTGFKPSTAGG